MPYYKPEQKAGTDIVLLNRMEGNSKPKRVHTCFYLSRSPRNRVQETGTLSLNKDIAITIALETQHKEGIIGTLCHTSRYSLYRKHRKAYAAVKELSIQTT